jgi:hypothetical protein
MGFLLLGIDSLIACLAIGAIVGRPSRVPLAAAFGIADGIAFLLGSAVGVRISVGATEVLQTATLVGLGLWLVVVATGARRFAATWPVWVVPWALTVDNLAFGLVGDRSAGSLLGQAGQQALSSSLLALVGLLVGAALPRVIPAIGRSRIAATQFAGAALVLVAGVELLAG